MIIKNVTIAEKQIIKKIARINVFMVRGGEMLFKIKKAEALYTCIAVS